MKTVHADWRWLKRGLLGLLATTVVACTTAFINADGLDKYTGYTRPGSPPDVVKEGKIVPVAADDKKAIGGTVYFRVYDLAEGQNTDTWGTGYKDLEKMFQPGLESTGRHSPALDRTARFLYVYQIVNDRGTPARIHSATVRLLVEPGRITSWGYFASGKKGEKDGLKGVSFCRPLEDPKKIVPVSAEKPFVGPTLPEKLFKNPADHYPMPKTPTLCGMAVGNKPVANDPAAVDTGRAPAAVVLMRSANFEGAPPPLPPPLGMGGAAPPGMPPLMGGPVGAAQFPFGGPMGFGPPMMPPGSYLPPSSIYGPGYTVPGLGAPNMFRPFPAVGGPGVAEDADHFAAIRADFYDANDMDGPLAPKQRSVIFGFTCNDPPAYDVVRVRGSSNPVVPVAPGTTLPAPLLCDGSVPVPVTLENAAGIVAGVSFPMGFSGGGSSGAAAGTGGGGFPGGFGGGIGFGPGFGGGGGGGAPSGGGGGGTTPTTPTNQQQQQQQQQQTPAGTTVTVTVSQSQSQQQQQQQKQKQQQQQSQSQSNTPVPVQVIPEPATVISALLGLPAFYFLRRKRAAS